MSSAAGSYTQDFNTLQSSGTGHTWTDNSTIANWYSQRTGTGSLYDANTGSVTSAGNFLFSFGSTGSSDRALGAYSASTGTWTNAGNFAHGVLLRNTSGTTMTNIRVSWTLEQWRNSGVNSVHTISFWYKISPTSFTALTPNTSTGWTAVTTLNSAAPIMTSSPIPIGSLDGNASANKVIKTGISIPSLSLANNEYIMFKWDDPDEGGGDQSIAVDDVTIAWGTVLPVELMSFDAQTTEGGKTHLTWATGSETNSHSFDIERSQDGKTFAPIGTVKAQGKAANYSFVDNTPLSNMSYYRLKAIDNDQTFEYSKVVSVQNGKGKTAIRIYPTTTQDVLTVENNGAAVESVTVFNPMGQLVFTAKQVNQVDMRDLPAGLYIVRVQAGQDRVTEKVFKQ
jgi:Secretion system C-terminal sorting domain